MHYENHHEGRRWFVEVDRLHRPSERRWKANARTFARSLLSALEAACDEIPRTHLPRCALTAIGTEDDALLRSELPSVFGASKAVRAQFGGDMVGLVREIVAARGRDIKLKEEGRGTDASGSSSNFCRMEPYSCIAHTT
jgi:hypothetical protein